MSTANGYTVAVADSYDTTPAGTNALGETLHGLSTMTVSPVTIGTTTTLIVTNCYVELSTQAPYTMTVFAGNQTIVAPSTLVEDLGFPLKLDGYINAWGFAWSVNQCTLSLIS